MQASSKMAMGDSAYTMTQQCWCTSETELSHAIRMTSKVLFDLAVADIFTLVYLVSMLRMLQGSEHFERDPDDEEVEEATGNEGATMTRYICCPLLSVTKPR